jgi:uncharacterized UPF0160 family protein
MSVTITTHDNLFHLDDLFACAILELVLDAKGESYSIVRTRDKALIAKSDYVVDVGDIYDPSVQRFDHHQKSFTDTWDNTNERYKGIRLSSAGLIFKHYGKEVVRNMTKSVWNMDLTED